MTTQLNKDKLRIMGMRPKFLALLILISIVVCFLPYGSEPRKSLDLGSIFIPAIFFIYILFRFVKLKMVF